MGPGRRPGPTGPRHRDRRTGFPLPADEPPSPERTTRAPLDPSSARHESFTGFPNPQDPPRPTGPTHLCNPTHPGDFTPTPPGKTLTAPAPNRTRCRTEPISTRNPTDLDDGGRGAIRGHPIIRRIRDRPRGRRVRRRPPGARRPAPAPPRTPPRRRPPRSRSTSSPRPRWPVPHGSPPRTGRPGRRSRTAPSPRPMPPDRLCSVPSPRRLRLDETTGADRHGQEHGNDPQNENSPGTALIHHHDPCRGSAPAQHPHTPHPHRRHYPVGSV